jgi:hypothetical protein
LRRRERPLVQRHRLVLRVHLLKESGMKASSWLAGLLMAGALGGCGFGGSVFFLRNLDFNTTPDRYSLSPLQAASGRVQICPAIVDGSMGPVYQSGSYRLSVENLPPGVTATFPGGDTIAMTATGEAGATDVPAPGRTGPVRYCVERTLELRRDGSAGTAPPVAATLRLSIVAGGAGTDVHDRVLTVQRLDGSAGAPPPVAGSCSAGRWADLSPPAAQNVATYVFDATLVQDRLLLARATTASVLLDEQTDTGWQQSFVPTDGTPDSVAVRVTERAGAPLRLAAWRDTNYSRPRAEQTQVVLAVEDRATGRWTTRIAAADFESNVRSLQLVAWQGDAVVGWLSGSGPELRRPDPAAGWLTIPPPVALPATVTTREMRLAVDPVDQSLWLLLAVREADGVTRLRLWRSPGPGGAWETRPVLEAGPSSGPGDLTRGLGDATLVALRGEVLLAWTYGEASFSSTSRLSLQVRRATVTEPAWQTVGDTGTLAAAGTRYAWQPRTTQLAQGCGGATFLAWSETGDYPFGAVYGAVADAAGTWDPFGRANLAPLPGGIGAFGSTPRLLVPSDGRPLLVALLAPPSGGPSPVAVRRYAP